MHTADEARPRVDGVVAVSECGPEGGGPMPSLNAVRFDTTGYESRGEPRPGQVRVWFTPDGDGVGLYYFAVPPDLPVASSVDELRAFYASGLEKGGGRMVETSVFKFGGCFAVCLI